MKKLLVLTLCSFSLAGTLYAGGGCGSCSGKSADKKTDKTEDEVVVKGSESKECDSSDKKCGGGYSKEA